MHSETYVGLKECAWHNSTQQDQIQYHKHHAVIRQQSYILLLQALLHRLSPSAKGMTKLCRHSIKFLLAVSSHMHIPQATFHTLPEEDTSYQKKTIQVPMLNIGPDEKQPVSCQQAAPAAPDTIRLHSACKYAHQVAAWTRLNVLHSRLVRACAGSSSPAAQKHALITQCIGLLTGIRPRVGRLTTTDAQECSSPVLHTQPFKQHAARSSNLSQAKTCRWVTILG